MHLSITREGSKMDLSRDEKIMLSKFRTAKRYAQDNKQAELEIRILPGGRFSLVRLIFQEKVESEEENKS